MNAPAPIAHSARQEQPPVDSPAAPLPEAFCTGLEPASLPAPYVVGVRRRGTRIARIQP